MGSLEQFCSVYFKAAMTSRAISLLAVLVLKDANTAYPINGMEKISEVKQLQPKYPGVFLRANKGKLSSAL